jgi:hypothetical protein
MRDDNVDTLSDQFGGERRQLVHFFRPSPLDDDIATLDVAEVTHRRGSAHVWRGYHAT